jgi:outer membrane protein OmpA-like peptidoglycan-associated protein/Tfp pilus assembly protein PilF/Tol biopolymer transport system component
MKRIFFLIFLFTSFFSFSQKLSTQSKKAEKLFKEASQHLTYGHYYEATESLQKAINNDPNFVEAYLLLGDANRDQNQMEEALRYYKRGLEINPDLYPPIHFFVARMHMKNGEYEQAEQYYKSFLTYEDIDEYSKRNAERNILSCQFAKDALANPVEFEPANLGSSINSAYSEYFPTMTVDGKRILYTRLLGEQGRHQQEDFYFSAKDRDGNWQMSRNMGGTINSQLNEGAATISADGNLIIFTACEQYGDYGSNRTGYGSCDLFFTMNAGDYWTPPQNLGKPINSASWESQPSLSSDGKTLYFVRGKRVENRRESDIMMSTLDSEGYWGNPVALPSNINTEEPEGSVLIHPDNRTLYFSSNGHPGMGGSDIFVSKKNENGEWGPAINLGYPINTYSDENSLLVGPDGEIGYFASDREGGFGGLDIYGFYLHEDIQADPVSFFKGIVYDSITKELLQANVELISADKGNLLTNTFSDPYDGSFFMTLTPQYNYVINISKPGYLFYSDGVFIKEQYDRLKPYVKNIPLLPLQVGNSVVLKNIFFELDKSTLMTESEAELRKLQQFLNNNPNVKIEIGGHTDNQGTFEYNQKLSEERAKSVFEYLIDNGISSERLAYKGYSFDKPIADNETEEGRAQNRRTEFKILEIQ